MKFYIASRFSRAAGMREAVADIRKIGHETTSRWMFFEQDDNPETQMQWSANDLADVRAADGLIFFAEYPDAGFMTGGRHVEFGIAVERGIPIYVIGPKENIFHWLEYVEHFNTWEDFLEEFEVDNG